MRIKLIEDLPMATSAELYQLSWVIEQPLVDPRRIVQVRAQLHTGQRGEYPLDCFLGQRLARPDSRVGRLASGLDLIYSSAEA